LQDVRRPAELMHAYVVLGLHAVVCAEELHSVASADAPRCCRRRGAGSM